MKEEVRKGTAIESHHRCDRKRSEHLQIASDNHSGHSQPCQQKN
jgi:hypothetical protein